VLKKEPEIQRITKALREKWKEPHIAPGTALGSQHFLGLSEAFAEKYVFADWETRLSFHRPGLTAHCSPTQKTRG